MTDVIRVLKTPSGVLTIILLVLITSVVATAVTYGLCFKRQVRI